jgi:FKBP-type peptidyl-prolyl cis-trans isomerase 2
MKVEKGKLVTINYTLRTAEGELIESSEGRGAPLSFIQGEGRMIPGVEEKLEGLEPGVKKEFLIPPEKAFGVKDSGPVKEMLKSEFPKDTKFEIGAKFTANMPEGGGPVNFTILEVKEQTVKVRFTHPLAGKAIKCEVEVLEVKEPSEKS